MESLIKSVKEILTKEKIKFQQSNLNVIYLTEVKTFLRFEFDNDLQEITIQTETKNTFGNYILPISQIDRLKYLFIAFAGKIEIGTVNCIEDKKIGNKLNFSFSKVSNEKSLKGAKLTDNEKQDKLYNSFVCSEFDTLETIQNRINAKILSITANIEFYQKNKFKKTIIEDAQIEIETIKEIFGIAEYKEKQRIAEQTRKEKLLEISKYKIFDGLQDYEKIDLYEKFAALDYLTSELIMNFNKIIFLQFFAQNNIEKSKVENFCFYESVSKSFNVLREIHTVNNYQRFSFKDRQNAKEKVFNYLFLTQEMKRFGITKQVETSLKIKENSIKTKDCQTLNVFLTHYFQTEKPKAAAKFTNSILLF